MDTSRWVPSEIQHRLVDGKSDWIAIMCHRDDPPASPTCRVSGSFTSLVMMGLPEGTFDRLCSLEEHGVSEALAIISGKP